jgi:tripartite-type tricarboxylate transporter receptor subunit TctC
MFNHDPRVDGGQQREPTMSRPTLAIAAIAIGFVLNAVVPVPSVTQDWPTRPITLVIPYAAGGANDVIGRILSPHISEILRQQVIIENIGGAGGMIGAQRVAKAAPDGYQFVLGNVGSHAANQTLYKHPLYNATTDFAPVALIAEQPLVLIARKDLPADNLSEFIAYTKANQAKMQYGSAGAGSTTHLACALVNLAIGVNVMHVAYRGGGPAMQDLIAGRIDYQCPSATAAIPLLEGKLAKAIAILTKNRSRVLPNLASAQEQGLKDFEFDNWHAFFLPTGTPTTIIRKLHEATVATMDRPAVQERLRQLGAEVVAPERRSPEYLQGFVEREIKNWAAIIKASGMAMN